MLGQRVPGATLTIVGGVDPRHLDYWGRVVRRAVHLPNVHFAGPDARVFEFLAGFRAFAMISREQGCPNASLEAMAAGLPVVANDDGGTREQVVDGVTGYLVRGDDPSEMAERLAHLLTNPALSERLGHNARRHVLTHFSMQAMVDRYRAVLPSPTLAGASRSGFTAGARVGTARCAGQAAGSAWQTVICATWWRNCRAARLGPHGR